MRAALGTYFSRIASMLVPDVHCRMPAGIPPHKTLYLTFDDGPTESGTSELLDILEEHEAPATFFLVGENAARHPRHVRRLLDAGHAIGNHTHTHLDAWKAPMRKLIWELRRCTEILEDISGANVQWMRPPFGRLTPGMVEWSRRKRQQLLMWDVMPPDFEHGTTIDRVARNFLTNVKPGSVICLHDNAKARNVTPAVLRRAIPQLLADGWTFARL